MNIICWSLYAWIHPIASGIPDVWAKEIREMARFAWHGYKQVAFGMDEVHPVSGGGRQFWALATTLVDALDTLWLLNLRHEFYEAEAWIAKNLDFNQAMVGDFFEITIRVLGGLLGAHSVSGRFVFLDKARDLAERLLHAFPQEQARKSEAAKQGISEDSREMEMHLQSMSLDPFPKAFVHVGKNYSYGFPPVPHNLAATCSFQLEFQYLSYMIGDSRFANVGGRALESLHAMNPEMRLMPNYFRWKDKGAVPEQPSKVTIGSHSDSYYEYLLKLFLQNGKEDTDLQERWIGAMQDMISRLVFEKPHFSYVGELSEDGVVRHQYEHLACWVAGSLALGTLMIPDRLPDMFINVAVNLAKGCREMYNTPLGLPADVFAISDSGMHALPDQNYALLRPEAVEAFYYLYYLTGDPMYQRWAYDIAVAINRTARTRWGFSAMDDSTESQPQQRDSVESFFFAETLKYLYLIMKGKRVLRLEQFVFNTEAHPLRIFNDEARIMKLQYAWRT